MKIMRILEAEKKAYEILKQLPGFTPIMALRIIKQLNIPLSRTDLYHFINSIVKQGELDRLSKGTYVWKEVKTNYENLISNDDEYKLMYNWIVERKKSYLKDKDEQFISNLALGEIIINDSLKQLEKLGIKVGVHRQVGICAGYTW